MPKPKHDPKIPTVTLGGKEWKIPPLAVRQLREVRAPLIEMNARMLKANGTASNLFSELGRDDYEALILRPVYYGLSRADAELEYDSFLDMEIDDGDLIAAWFVVRQQSGIFVKRGEADAGEAKAARTKTQTST